MLLTEAPLTSRAQREKLVRTWFETFRVPALHVAAAPTLACYGSGRTTALVVDVGDGVTSVTPVYEGYAVPHAVQRVDVGGRDVTAQLLWHLRKAGHTFHTSAEAEAVRVMREAACYGAASPAAAEAAAAAAGGSGAGAADYEYTLPDGVKLTLGAERFRAPEVLFQPRLLGLEADGVGEAVAAALLRSDLEMRAPLAANVQLAGGCTAVTGFGSRLLTEMRKSVPPDTPIKIWAPANRKMLAWVGGSILASLSTFSGLCIRKAAWEEEGERLLHRGHAV